MKTGASASQQCTVEVKKMDKTIKIRQATKEGFTECEIGGVADLNYLTSKTRRGRTVEKGNICPTLTTENIPSVIELGDPDFYNFLYEIDGEIYLIRIRKLIPLECWRLMGFTDEDFHKAEQVNSNTQLYKQAGNSIVKDVLMAIFRNMNIEGVKQWQK
jgi:DNA (cytosine-5)-methyltransferase 1